MSKPKFKVGDFVTPKADRLGALLSLGDIHEVLAVRKAVGNRHETEIEIEIEIEVNLGNKILGDKIQRHGFDQTRFRLAGKRPTVTSTGSSEYDEAIEMIDAYQKVNGNG